MNPVWIIDDDRSIRWVFEKALAREEILLGPQALELRRGARREDPEDVDAARLGGHLPLVEDREVPQRRSVRGEQGHAAAHQYGHGACKPCAVDGAQETTE